MFSSSSKLHYTFSVRVKIHHERLSSAVILFAEALTLVPAHFLQQELPYAALYRTSPKESVLLHPGLLFLANIWSEFIRSQHSSVDSASESSGEVFRFRPFRSLKK